MSSAGASAKTALRRRLRQSLAELSVESAKIASRRIREHLTDYFLGTAKNRRAIAAFAALPGEPDLMSLLFADASPEDQLTWHLPRVEGEQTLQLYRVTSPTELAPGRFGIREPDPSRCAPVASEKIDLFLVPGVGFDPATGHRLGRGKGYYDRLLAAANPDAEIIGVGFDRQLAHVAHETHDVPVTRICTESGLREVDSGDSRE